MSSLPPSPDPSELPDTLARLRSELAGSPRLDEASRAQLKEALEDIERLLDNGEPDAPVPSSRLEALAVRFEADHPSLAGSLRELIDLLGRAGL